MILWAAGFSEAVLSDLSRGLPTTHRSSKVGRINLVKPSVYSSLAPLILSRSRKEKNIRRAKR